MYTITNLDDFKKIKNQYNVVCAKCEYLLAKCISVRSDDLTCYSELLTLKQDLEIAINSLIPNSPKFPDYMQMKEVIENKVNIFEQRVNSTI